MGNIKRGRIVLCYLWEKRKVIGMFILYEMIFVIVCSLYQLHNLGKLLYAVWLSLFLSLCYGLWDFIQYKKRIDALYRVYINEENIITLLPQSQNLQEKYYQEILRSLWDKRQRLVFNADLKETEMVDYYTLWAHQIKTPIAAMKLLLENGEKQGFNYELLEETFKIEHYVEMVLHYLRLDSMASDMLFEEYAIESIVNQAIKKHAILFINSKLSLYIKPFQFTVITDDKWLSFVIEQLIANAVKYTIRGSISIYMENNLEKDVLVIEDTGMGIRREDLPRIFERGFTGYNGRLDKKSTGIGLYLCKQILDKLSYEIEVQSEVGKGTKVCIVFLKNIL